MKINEVLNTETKEVDSWLFSILGRVSGGKRVKRFDVIIQTDDLSGDGHKKAVAQFELDHPGWDVHEISLIGAPKSK